MLNSRAKERLNELQVMLTGLASNEGDMLSLMREAIDSWEPSDEFSQRGAVLSVGDGIAVVSKPRKHYLKFVKALFGA